MCSMLHIVNNLQITISYTLIEKNVLYTLSMFRIVNSVQIETTANLAGGEEFSQAQSLKFNSTTVQPGE